MSPATPAAAISHAPREPGPRHRTTRARGAREIPAITAAAGEITPLAGCRRCHRCRRPLTAAASIARGYGPGCLARIRARAAALAVAGGHAPRQIEKALELITDGGLVPATRPGVYRAVSSDGSTIYLTHAATCACPGGLHGRYCYHSLAARIVTTRQAA